MQLLPVMESFIVPAAIAMILSTVAGVIYILLWRSTSQPSWPKVKQYVAYTQKVTPITRKALTKLSSLRDLTPVGKSQPVHDVAAFFVSRGNEFSMYSVDWEQESAVLIRPVEGTDLKKHPFYCDAQLQYAAEVLVIPLEQLQAVVDVIADKTAHVQEVFVYMTARSGSTLLTRAVEATSSAQAISEPDILSVIANQIFKLRRASQYGTPSQDRTGSFNLLDESTAVSLMRNVISLLNYHLVISDHGHRHVIFYKLKSDALFIGDLMRRAFPSAKTVFLYRNGLDVWESYMKIFYKNKTLYVAHRLAIRLGLWRWAPNIPDYFHMYGDDPKFSAVRLYRTGFYYIVAAWVGPMQHAIELQKRYPEDFFHAVINYPALAKGKEKAIRLMMEKLGIPWNQEDLAEENKRIKTAFVKDSQAGTYLSSRTTSPGQQWKPQSSSSWFGAWEREYLSVVGRQSGNEIPPDVILPHTMLL